jgi:hypothetical protein
VVERGIESMPLVSQKKQQAEEGRRGRKKRSLPPSRVSTNHNPPFVQSMRSEYQTRRGRTRFLSPGSPPTRLSRAAAAVRRRCVLSGRAGTSSQNEQRPAALMRGRRKSGERKSTHLARSCLLSSDDGTQIREQSLRGECALFPPSNR